MRMRIINTRMHMHIRLEEIDSVRMTVLGRYKGGQGWRELQARRKSEDGGRLVRMWVYVVLQPRKKREDSVQCVWVAYSPPSFVRPPCSKVAIVFFFLQPVIRTKVTSRPWSWRGGRESTLTCQVSGEISTVSGMLFAVVLTVRVG